MGILQARRNSECTIADVTYYHIGFDPYVAHLKTESHVNLLNVTTL